MERIAVSREIASDKWKLYKELKSRGIELSGNGRMRFFSIYQDPENSNLFWISESKELYASASPEIKESQEEPKTIMQESSQDTIVSPITPALSATQRHWG